jgi:alkylation response protein AidB-like acyl-CoA dehydrogenase
VDFELTADQVSLQEAIRAFCDGRFPPDVVRTIEDAGGRLDRGRWRELGDTGVFALRVPEGRGVGLGLGASEAVLVFEELGRALVPGPLVATELAARFVPEAATGECIVGLADTDDGVVVVEYPDDLDGLLVVEPGGVRLVQPGAPPGVDAVRPLDALTPVRWVNAPLPPSEPVGGPEVVDDLRRAGRVLTGALQLGIAARTVELANDYAKEREQFGRPIGSFQAVKHLIADMLVRSEVARAAVYAAACAIDGRSDDDPDRAAAVAKVVAGEAALVNAKTCIQVHGGIGYTWELDVQRYWKRASVLDTHFGNRDECAQSIAVMVGEKAQR